MIRSRLTPTRLLLVIALLVTSHRLSFADDTVKPVTPPPPHSSPSKAQMAAGKQFFDRGQNLYKEGKFEAAWLEFSSAYEIAPVPDLVFNMARCEARMNRLKEAIGHYKEFLAAKPDDPEADRIRDEIARLDRQMNGIVEPLPPPPPPPAQPPKRPFPIITAALGGAAVLFVLFGGISAGVAHSRFNGLSEPPPTGCKPNCTDDQVGDVRTPLNAGYAMFGLAAAAAVGAAIALPFELGLFNKDNNKQNQVALGIGPGSIEVVGRF